MWVSWPFPFVPGAEVGIAMLTAFGAAIAPLVYVATVRGDDACPTRWGGFCPARRWRGCLAFCGCARRPIWSPVPPRCHRMSGSRCSSKVRRPERSGLALRHRYVALAVIVNVPGNAMIGGGGGIMMMAGMSGNLRAGADLPRHRHRGQPGAGHGAAAGGRKLRRFEQEMQDVAVLSPRNSCLPPASCPRPWPPCSPPWLT